MVEEATFIYGQKSMPIPLTGLTPKIIANKFNVDLDEIYLIDSKQKLVTIDKEKFDCTLDAGECYRIFDNTVKPFVDLALVTQETNKQVKNFKHSLLTLLPIEKINSIIKMQELVVVAMNANDICLVHENYKHVKNTKSLRAAVHDLISAVNKTYLETSMCAGEIHTGLNNILKGIPDILQEVQDPSEDSIPLLHDLESWMIETLDKCYDQSEKASQLTELLVKHVYELERALIASLGYHETNTSDNEKNKQILELLKKQNQQYELAKQLAKNKIEETWNFNVNNAYKEYNAARETCNKIANDIFEVEFKIEKTNKNEIKNKDALILLRQSILEISEVKENWRNASCSFSLMRNKLKVEKEAKRWEYMTSKIDLNKHCLVTNLLQFLAIGYKVDSWMHIQNLIIKDYLLPLASKANERFAGKNISNIKNDGAKLIEEVSDMVKNEQSKMVDEYETDLRKCLSLHSVATIFHLDGNHMIKQ